MEKGRFLKRSLDVVVVFVVGVIGFQTKLKITSHWGVISIHLV